MRGCTVADNQMKGTTYNRRGCLILEVLHENNPGAEVGRVERLPTNGRKGVAKTGIKAAGKHRSCGQRGHGRHRKKAGWLGH